MELSDVGGKVTASPDLVERETTTFMESIGQQEVLEWKSPPDPLSERVIILFNPLEIIATGKKYQIRNVDFLGDPEYKFLLWSTKDFDRIGAGIRFGFGDMPKPPYSKYPQLSYLLKHPKTDNDIALAKLVYDTYSLWSQYNSILKVSKREDVLSILRKPMLFVNAPLALDRPSPFRYTPDIISSSPGVISSLIVGKKDYLQFGLMQLERGFWMMFLASIGKIYLDKSYGYDSWRIRVDFGLKPPHYIVSMRIRCDRRSPKDKDVICTIPSIDMFWDALYYVIRNIPSDAIKGGHPFYFGC
jgi:hypothetical protein